MLEQTQMEQEQVHLAQTQAEIDKQLSAYGEEAELLRQTTREQRKYIWDNRIDLDSKESYFEEAVAAKYTESFGETFNEWVRLKRMKQSPYFARIDFAEPGDPAEQVYIGSGSLVDDRSFDVYIYDWRSPIAGMYYDFELGSASYQCEAGEISGEITLKRQYRIEHGVMKEAFDSSVTVLDEILQSILSADAQEKMRPIVTTIQREQNTLIREEDSEILVIQGAAGSGKTSVALHRVAYLLYRRRNKLNESNILILSPNDYFSEYISGVLPELGEKNVRQLTMPQLISAATPRQEQEELPAYLEQAYTIGYTPAQLEETRQKTSAPFTRFLEERIARLTQEGPSFTDLTDGEGTVILSGQEMQEIFCSCVPSFTMVQRLEKVSTYFVSRAETYKQRRLSVLRQRLLAKNGDNFYLDSADLDRDVRLAWMQQYHQLRETFFSSIALDEAALYQELLSDFWEPKTGEAFAKAYASGRLSYPDAAAFAYLRLLLGLCKPDGDILHVVVDEAQDYNFLHYRMLGRWFYNARFTILGDPSQILSPALFDSREGFQYMLDAFSPRRSGLKALEKRYRSTWEINTFADRILGLQGEKVERHGPAPQVIKVWDTADYVKQAFSQADEQGCAVIVKTGRQATALYQQLRGIPGITCIDGSAPVSLGKRVILPAYLAKGLEFDQVIVLTQGFTPQDNNLFYVCCTRALHQLTIVTEE